MIQRFPPYVKKNCVNDMNSYDQYYLDVLYPLQDGVMSIIRKLNTPFFLTGGTALSRHYVNHRYSDDLDLFVAADDRYQEWIEKIFEELFRTENTSGIIVERTSLRRLQDFSQVFVHFAANPKQSLKIDFVNDVAAHYGEFEVHKQLGAIDSWRNILSNKVCALFRFEPKDVTDIWILAKKKQFHWKTIIEEAKTKEAGVEPEIIYNIIRSFPIEKLDIIRWVQKPDYKDMKKDLEKIADDVFYGKENSLCGH